MNYESQVECETNIDILTLRALTQILRASKDFLTGKTQTKIRNEGINILFALT